MSTLFSYFSIFQYFVCNKTEIFKFNRRVEVKGAEDYNKGQGSRQLFLRSSCYIVTSTGSPLLSLQSFGPWKGSILFGSFC